MLRETVVKGSPRMSGLFARAGLSIVPGASALPWVGGGGGSSMPSTALVRTGVRVSRDRLAAYDRVCGFDLSDTLPATYPHVLCFPLQLSLMVSPRSPVAAIGLVHVSNRIVVHRPLRLGEPLSLRVGASELRPHPRGRAFDLRSEAWVDSELVWEEVSTNLARGRRDDAVPPVKGPPDSSGLPATATWRLPGDLGRRYAGVSGDRNPIHLHPLTARAFGFPTAIAHGMWTAARCLAQLGTETGDAFAVDVAFRRPIRLPGRVTFAEARGEDGLAFGVRDARTDAVHLDGRLTPTT